MIGLAVVIAFAMFDVIGWMKSPVYVALGEEMQRQERYQKFLHVLIPKGEWYLIREAVQRGQLTGRSLFRRQVGINSRKAERKRSSGRPKKSAPNVVVCG